MTVNKTSRTRKLVAGIALAGSILLVTGCAGNAEPEPAETTAVSASPETTPEAKPGTTPSKTVNGLSAAGVINTDAGDYLQATISEDDPAIEKAVKLAGEDVKSVFTPEEIESGTEFILKFMVEEGIDSPLNGSLVSVDAWWEDHKDLFAPEYTDAKIDLNAGKSFVILEKWQQETYGDKYRYILDTETPRVTELNINPTQVFAAGNSIAIEATVDYSMRVEPGVGNGTSGEKGIQKSSGTMTYSARLVDGEWAITGYHHDVNTFEAK